MANEPPCWILDENRKDTGKRDYSKCWPIVCTVECNEGAVMGVQRFQIWKPKLVDDQEHLLRLLKNVKIRKAIRAIVSERDLGQVGK
jgi:hypothetical protein